MVEYEYLYQIAVFCAILIITGISSKVISIIIKGWFRSWTPVVRAHVQRLISVSVWVVGVMLAVQQIGLSIDFLLLLIGLFGFGVLLAIRGALENIGARYFHDVYVPFKVGEVIMVGGSSGKVIEINPITTILLTADEKLISVPNSLFLHEKVENLTPHVWREILVPMTISGNMDLPEFEDEILRTCNKMRVYLDERFPPVLTVKDRSEKSVDLVLTLMVKKTSKKNEIIREINQKINEMESEAKNRISGFRKMKEYFASKK